MYFSPVEFTKMIAACVIGVLAAAVILIVERVVEYVSSPLYGDIAGLSMIGLMIIALSLKRKRKPTEDS